LAANEPTLFPVKGKLFDRNTGMRKGAYAREVVGFPDVLPSAAAWAGVERVEERWTALRE
jgi:hypothetical protein